MGHDRGTLTPMPAPLNYHHLYYFWVVAKEGGMARAAARLDMAGQTVSAQVRALGSADNPPCPAPFRKAWAG